MVATVFYLVAGVMLSSCLGVSGGCSDVARPSLCYLMGLRMCFYVVDVEEEVAAR